MSATATTTATATATAAAAAAAAAASAAAAAAGKKVKAKCESSSRYDWDPNHLIEHWCGHLDELQWVHKSAYTQCVHCKDAFTTGHKHHCRLCGQMFCSRCTGKYHVPPRFKVKGKKGAVRVCVSCRDACLERRKAFELSEERQARKNIEAGTDRINTTVSATDKDDNKDKSKDNEDDNGGEKSEQKRQHEREASLNKLRDQANEMRRHSSQATLSNNNDSSRASLPVGLAQASATASQSESSLLHQSSTVSLLSAISSAGMTRSETLFFEQHKRLPTFWKERRRTRTFPVPDWDSVGSYDRCAKCQACFKSRKGMCHNCRACGRLICSDCSTKMVVPRAFIRKLHKQGPRRVCDECRFVLKTGAIMAQTSHMEQDVEGVLMLHTSTPTASPRPVDAQSSSSPASAPPVADDDDDDSVGRGRPPAIEVDSDEEDFRRLSSIASSSTPTVNAPATGGGGGGSSLGVPKSTQVRRHSAPHKVVRQSFVHTCGHPGCQLPRVTRGFCHEHSPEDALYVMDSPQPLEQRNIDKNQFRSDYRRDQSSRIDAISRPFNVQHRTHVDAGYKWTGENLEEAFDLVEKIGEGAYGEVYRARHKDAGFELAVKTVLAASDEEQVQALYDEINIIKKCKHDNVIGYYGCWGPDSRGRMWILMDLCAGSVPDVIRTTRTQMTESQVAFILASALAALSYLHRKGIFHRDIKGNNILITQRGRVKITDFGVSTQVEQRVDALNSSLSLNDDLDDQGNGNDDDDDDGDGGKAQPAQRRPTAFDMGMEEEDIAGSILWMAPEMISGHPVEFKGDVWSLGITAIELAEGRVPYERTSLQRARRGILTQPPPTLKKPYWSSAFRDFVSKCLVKDPKQRPHAKQLLAHPFIMQAFRSMATARTFESIHGTDESISKSSVAAAHAATTAPSYMQKSSLLSLIKRYNYLVLKGARVPGSFDMFQRDKKKKKDEKKKAKTTDTSSSSGSTVSDSLPLDQEETDSEDESKDVVGDDMEAAAASAARTLGQHARAPSTLVLGSADADTDSDVDDDQVDAWLAD